MFIHCSHIHLGMPSCLFDLKNNDKMFHGYIEKREEPMKHKRSAGGSLSFSCTLKLLPFTF